MYLSAVSIYLSFYPSIYPSIWISPATICPQAYMQRVYGRYVGIFVV